MNFIAGLQKTTVIDYPEHVACTIFTNGCNFRCPYCHNSSLVLDPLSEPIMSEAALLQFLDRRKGLLDGVCFTGGEPLMHKGLLGLIQKTKGMGYLVKLDTNGSYPQRLEEYLEQGLIDYVAMDLKHTPEHYDRAVGGLLVAMDKIRRSVELLMAGDIPYEFRTTVVKGIHTVEDLEGISHWIKGAKAYYLQNYQGSDHTIASRIEGNNNLASFDEEELEQFVEVIRKRVPNVRIRSV